MRQVKKARIVFFILGLIIGCVAIGALGFMMVSDRDQQIVKLNELKADGKVYAFARNIKANSEILPGDIKEIETKVVNFANGGYYGTLKTDEKGNAVKDAAGNEKFDFKHYILVRDENGNEKQKTIKVSSSDVLTGKTVKADVYVNQPVTDSVLYPDDDIPAESERYVEYNFLQLPSDLEEDDYVDVRVQFPTGEDYLVLVGKKVSLGSMPVDTPNTVFLKLTEDEQLAMGSAIIESYMDTGVRLYARKYTDPASQLFDESKVNLVADYKQAYEKAKANLLAELANARPVSGDKEKVNKEPSIADIKYNSEYLRLVKDSVIEDVKDAIESNDDETLTYFSAYRLTSSKKLARTYPLKSEVLNLVKTRPNILQEIVDEFTMISNNNTREDKLQRLWKQYNDPATLTEQEAAYMPNNSKIKTKEMIYSEILSLEEQRQESIAKNLETELKTSREQRQAYLNWLLGGSSSSN